MVSLVNAGVLVLRQATTPLLLIWMMPGGSSEFPIDVLIGCAPSSPRFRRVPNEDVSTKAPERLPTILTSARARETRPSAMSAEARKRDKVILVGTSPGCEMHTDMCARGRELARKSQLPRHVAGTEGLGLQKRRP